MKDKEFKRITESKKEDVIKAFKNKLTLKKWDGYSPVWTYNTLTDEVEYISDIVCIKMILTMKHFVSCFLEKKDLDTYKWAFDTIDTEISDRLSEIFENKFDNFVDFRDSSLGYKNCFYVNDKL